jgi:hypothetical protein
VQTLLAGVIRTATTDEQESSTFGVVPAFVQPFRAESG